MKPFLLILSAPSGGGKTTIAHALLDARDDVSFSVSATTRTPRAGEVDGEDYYFLTRDEFERRIKANQFLEWAEYSGNLYGTLESEVERILGDGQNVVLDIEVQGARQVRERSSNVVSIFILPPSTEVLVERLTARKTESQDIVAQRLRRAVEEVAEAEAYDYIIVNDDRMEAVADVARVLDAEKHRATRAEDALNVIAELREGLAREAIQRNNV